MKGKTVMLKNIPSQIDGWIRQEQLRLEMFEQKNLKKAQVVYQMLYDWYRLKNIENELIKQNENT